MVGVIVMVSFMTILVVNFKLILMKKNLLILFLVIAGVAKAQTPDFTISNATAETFGVAGDSLKLTFSVTSDTNGLVYTLGFLLSDDPILDASDQLVGTGTNTSSATATHNVTFNQGFTNSDIDSLDKYIIAVVTHDFSGDFQDVFTGGFAEDANFLDNVAIVSYAFSPEVVMAHNGVEEPVDTTNLRTEEAIALIKVSTYEYSALNNAGIILYNVDPYQVEFQKNFGIENGLPINLEDVLVSVYLSEDGEIDASDLFVSQETIMLRKDSETIYEVNNNVWDQVYGIAGLSDIGFWAEGNLNPEVMDDFSSNVILTLQFGLGDTINVNKTINYGIATFRWDIIEGVSDQLSDSDFRLQNMVANTMSIVSTNAGELNVYDVNGVLKMNHTIVEGVSSLDMTGLKKGMYIVSFESEKGSRKERIIVR